MKSRYSTLFLLSIFIAGITCVPTAGSAEPVHLLDLTGISLTDAAGNPANDFAPGNAVNIEAAFTLTRTGIAWLRGTVTGGNWSAKLPLKFRVGLKGDYRVTWTITTPLIATGLAQVEITLANPLQERLISSAFFTVTPVQAEYAGSDACSLCHPAVFTAWQQTRHNPFISCEVCHGPGSKHILTLSPQFIVINTSSGLCGGCHSRNDGSVIEAQNGFIKYQQQYNEWLGTSHAQADISCATCHNPHYSVSTDRTRAIKVACTTCHPTKHVGLTMEGLVDCEQCHMPRAVLKFTSAGIGLYRTGDERTHIVRIKTEANPQEMFLPGGTALREDAQGAFITDNFACLGCHNGEIARFETFEDVRKTSTLVH
jgi:hypothetical protein